MRKKAFFIYSILFAVILIGAVLSYLNGNTTLIGISLISAFVTLAIGIRSIKSLKGFSYTIWIFTAVTASLFFPQYFLSIGNFELKKLIIPLLQIIMFGMGSQMSLNDFSSLIKMPKAAIIGVCLQYTVMPFIGFSIAFLFNFPPEIAAGIILIGCVPSGVASNVMTFLAKANLALAVTISATSTLLSPLITPLLMKWLGGQFIEINFWNMMFDISNMIILPIIAGFIFNLYFKKAISKKSRNIQLISYLIIILIINFIFIISKNASFKIFIIHFAKTFCWFYLLPMVGAITLLKLLNGNNNRMEKILSLISMVGIAASITIITAAGRDNLLQVGGLLLITSLLHNLAGYTLGYTLSWILGMPERDRRTIAFEVGMQNGALAVGLALQMGKEATVGLAPAIFGPQMNITGSALANWWRGKPVKEEKVNLTDNNTNLT